MGLGLGIRFVPYSFIISSDVRGGNSSIVSLYHQGQECVVCKDHAGDFLFSQGQCHQAASASAGLGRLGVCS